MKQLIFLHKPLLRKHNQSLLRWVEMDRIIRNWIKLDRMDQTRSKWAKLDQTELNGLKWTKVYRTRPKCFTGVAQYIGAYEQYMLRFNF